MEYWNIPEKVFDLMKQGLYRTKLSGTCQIELVDDETKIQFSVILSNGSLFYTEHPKGTPDAYVRMKPKVMTGILSSLDTFDLRNPAVLSEVVAHGDLALASFLFSLLKRPSKQVQHWLGRIDGSARNRTQRVDTIERINNPSAETVVELLSAGVPFVATNVLNKWEALDWGLDEVRKHYGSFRLRPVVGANRERFESLGDFIDKMQLNNDNRIYTEGCDLPPAMWSKFVFPFFNWKTFTAPQIWLGTKSGDVPCTEMHRDSYHGFLANIFGRKKLILYSPEQADYLYPIEAYNAFQLSLVKQPNKADLSEFPRFKAATAIEVTIGPGDMLVIPAFWFHAVYALDDVFSVSCGMHWDAWEALDLDYQARQRVKICGVGK